MLGKRIAIIGAGAVGGYVGAHMAQAGEDVLFVDMWPEHVEAMRGGGLRISHLKDVPEFTVPVQAIHLTELQQVSRQRPFDIVFMCVKSYDTEWATAMARQYLAPGGYVVSLQNCMNEATIAGVVGWGRTLGAIASSITVELCEPGHVRRASGKGGAAHTVFRVGEVHGRVTPRAEEVGRLCALADSCLVTTNLWGERWSKLVTNAMGNGLSACTGLISREIVLDDRLRAFQARLGAEAIRVGQALGYALEEIHHMAPELIARAGEGDPTARAAFDAHRIAEAQKPGGGAHRPSMGQDMMKGRRTEIEFLNGFVVEQAKTVGIATPANAALTGIVQRVERGELVPDPDHIRALRLN
jgi:2-dehydropantoate 2-reductase